MGTVLFGVLKPRRVSGEEAPAGCHSVKCVRGCARYHCNPILVCKLTLKQIYATYASFFCVRLVYLKCQNLVCKLF